MSEPVCFSFGDDEASVQAALPNMWQDAHMQLRSLAERHRQEQEQLFHALFSNAASESQATATPQADRTATACRPCTSDCASSMVTALAKAVHESQPDVVGQRPGRPSIHDFEERAFHHAGGGSSTRVSSIVERWEQRLVSFSENTPGFGSSRFTDALSTRLVPFLHRAWGAEEPERNGVLARIVKSGPFAVLCILCIALNAVFMVQTANYEMSNPADETPSRLLLAEMMFVAFYMVELALKLLVHRLFFFWCEDMGWNILDFCLVLLSVLEVFIAILPTGVNVSYARTIRLFQVAKVLRVVRTIRYFRELRLLFDCVLGSLLNLMWCVVMIVFIVYIFSQLIVQGLAQRLREPPPIGSADLSELEDRFGSVQSGMMTLIQSTTGGIEWGKVHNTLASCEEFLHWAFLAYVIFFALAAWNIVTSLFVEKALNLAQPDVETLMTQQSDQDVLDAEELRLFFQELDEDQDGRLSPQEFHGVMRHKRFRTFLRVRGIEIHDVGLFHKMLQSVSGEDVHEDIEINFLVGACLRMRGQASCMDLHALSYEAKLMHMRQKTYMSAVGERLARIEDALSGLKPSSGANGAMRSI